MVTGVPRRTAALLLLPLLAVLVLPAVAAAQGPDAPPPTTEELWASFGDSADVNKHFLRAFSEAVAVNGLVWAYDRYLRAGPEGTKQGEGFRISFDSWWENIKNGFEWDDNNFSTNQFAHPYHGNLYYNAGRSNGYNYWESTALSFVGSFMWEYFGETHHPSINDWFATAIGGAALGESFYRLSDLVLDNRATGASRSWREIGGAAINPMRGFNRLVTGEAFRVHDNAPDRTPSALHFAMRPGLRVTGEDRVWESDTTRVFISFEWRYGDPFLVHDKPFSNFDFMLQLNFNEKTRIGLMMAKGLLYATELNQGEFAENLFAVYQHYDYINNTAYEYGAQAVGPAFLSRLAATGDYATYASLHLTGILMGATQSDYGGFTGREYDYGPGVGVKFGLLVQRRGRDFLDLGYSESVIETSNGVDSTHRVSLLRAELEIPVRDFFGVGMSYWKFARNSDYKSPELEDVDVDFPEFRGYVTYVVD